MAQKIFVYAMFCLVYFLPQKGLDMSPISVWNRVTFIMIEFRNIEINIEIINYGNFEAFVGMFLCEGWDSESRNSFARNSGLKLQKKKDS